MIGLTVVGKPAATVMTSSPGRSRRSPQLAARSGAVSASRFADEPELTSSACRTPKKRAKSRSNCVGEAAGGQPEVERRSRPGDAARRRRRRGRDTGTGDSPGTNAGGGKASGVVLGDEVEDRVRRSSSSARTAQPTCAPGTPGTRRSSARGPRRGRTRATSRARAAPSRRSRYWCRISLDASLRTSGSRSLRPSARGSARPDLEDGDLAARWRS